MCIWVVVWSMCEIKPCEMMFECSKKTWTIYNLYKYLLALKTSSHKALFLTCSKPQLKNTSNQTWLATQGLSITDECAGAQQCNSLGRNLGIFYARHGSNQGFGRNENVMWFFVFLIQWLYDKELCTIIWPEKPHSTNYGCPKSRNLDFGPKKQRLKLVHE